MDLTTEDTDEQRECMRLVRARAWDQGSMGGLWGG